MISQDGHQKEHASENVGSSYNASDLKQTRMLHNIIRNNVAQKD